jgi:hypothetical protein
LLVVRVGLLEGHDRGVESSSDVSEGLASLLVLLVEAAHVPGHEHGGDEEEGPATDVDFDTEVVVRLVLSAIDERSSNLQDGGVATRGVGAMEREKVADARRGGLATRRLTA